LARELEEKVVIEMEKEGDWEHILPGYIEGTELSLGPSEREDLGPQTLRDRASMQAEWIRGEEGFFNQLFVARTEDGRIAGHVWVARVLNQFTGRSEALLLNIHVEEDFRMRGLSKQLVEVAEEWARGQDLTRIGLNVAVDNEPTVSLFRTIGYTDESARMTKILEEDRG
jgi:ribosomal protein S18 acetylase RimI-like enzyme